jgi:hypothetical protein
LYRAAPSARRELGSISLPAKRKRRLVGKASAFRSINEKNVSRVFKMYTRVAREFDRSHPPAMTEARLLDENAGWTKLKFENYVIAAMYGTAFVPKSLREQVDFSTSALTILLQDSEDLVAAVSNSDGVLVITKLLCREDAKYRECKRSYRKGVFDVHSGRELDLGTLAPKPKGALIDPHTFERQGN